MKCEEFFLWLEGYYGKYTRTVLRNSVAAYVRKIDEYKLSGIKEYLQLNFSTNYGAAPDIATLEIARKDIRDRPIKETYQLKAPEPDAKSMKVEVGQLMEIVLLKLAKNKAEREKGAVV